MLEVKFSGRLGSTPTLYSGGEGVPS